MTGRKIHPHYLQRKPSKMCKVGGCDGVRKSLGYCDAHAKRFQKGLDMTVPIKRRKKWDPICQIEGCGRPTRSLGMCSGHYTQQVRGQAIREIRVPSIHDEIGLASAHHRVTYLWGSAKRHPCMMDCGRQATNWAYDGTDPSQLLSSSRPGKPELVFYSRYPEFYMPMCQGCHHRRDGAARGAELREYRLWRQRTGQTLIAAEPTGEAPPCRPYSPEVVLATLGHRMNWN